MTRPSIGFTVSQRASIFGPDDLLDLLSQATLVDHSGLVDAVWVGDSLTTRLRADALVCLGALAAMTENVRLGIACMSTFPVRDPLQFAIQWSALDEVSRGRMTLTVCNGIQKINGMSAAEGALFGGVTDGQRPARIEEYVGLMRRLWTGEPVSFNGRFVSYDGIRISPTVQEHAPVWVAGHTKPGNDGADKFYDRLARFADGYMMSTSSPTTVAEGRARMFAALERAGRPTDGFAIGVYSATAIGDDRDSVVDGATAFLREYNAVPGWGREQTEISGMFGSAQHVVDQFGALFDAGATHVTVRLAAIDSRPQLDLLLEDVLPAAISPSS